MEQEMLAESRAASKATEAPSMTKSFNCGESAQSPTKDTSSALEIQAQKLNNVTLPYPEEASLIIAEFRQMAARLTGDIQQCLLHLQGAHVLQSRHPTAAASELKAQRHDYAVGPCGESSNFYS